MRPGSAETGQAIDQADQGHGSEPRNQQLRDEQGVADRESRARVAAHGQQESKGHGGGETAGGEEAFAVEGDIRAAEADRQADNPGEGNEDGGQGQVIMRRLLDEIRERQRGASQRYDGVGCRETKKRPRPDLRLPFRGSDGVLSHAASRLPRFSRAGQF